MYIYIGMWGKASYEQFIHMKARCWCSSSKISSRIKNAAGFPKFVSFDKRAEMATSEHEKALVSERLRVQEELPSHWSSSTRQCIDCGPQEPEAPWTQERYAWHGTPKEALCMRPQELRKSSLEWFSTNSLNLSDSRLPNEKNLRVWK